LKERRFAVESGENIPTTTAATQQNIEHEHKDTSVSLSDGQQLASGALSTMLSEKEKKVLKDSSFIASGFFLPWSDEDARSLSMAALQSSKTLYKDSSGFLALSSKQKSLFFKFARPTEIVKIRQQCGLTRNLQDIVVVKTVTPYTIRQQFITDCSFIAGLCVCAQFERRFQKRLVSSLLYPQLVANKKQQQSNQSIQLVTNPQGKYMVKLWLNGVARSVVIDDYVSHVLCKTSREINLGI